MLEYLGLFISPGQHVVDYTKKVVDRVRERGWLLVTGDDPTDGMVAVWSAIDAYKYPHCSMVMVNHTENIRPRVWARMMNETPIAPFRHERYLARDRLIVDMSDRVMILWNGEGAAVWEAYQYASQKDIEVFFVDFTKGTPVVTASIPKIIQSTLA